MPDYDKLLNAIDAAEETAYGSDSNGDLADERASAIDAYLGKNTLAAPEGRSQVVDRTVYETIQWIMPSLCAIFANGDDVVELPPLGPDDEKGAKQEAAYLNYLILQRNNWFQIFNTAGKDGLLNKAGYLYAFRDKRRQIEVERYERQTEQGLALILDDGAEIISSREYPDDKAQPQPVIDPMTGQPAVDPMTGQPMMQPPPMLYDVELRRVKEDVVYRIKALPPERCLIAETCTDVQVKDSDYFEYYDQCTLSDLRAMGYDVPDDIAEGDDDEGLEHEARNQYSERNWDELNPIDPAMRRVKCRWIWIRHDYDEDGISEMQHVVRVGREILHREEVNSIPIGVLCPDPLPHRHIGMSVADTTIDIQNIKTAILRQGLDNLYLNNNQRTFVDPSMVNVDDLIKSRPGGVVRGKPGAVFGQHLAPIVTPFVFPQAIEGLAYMEQVTEGRTGVNRYFQGTDQNALNKTATGIQQLSTMAAQRVQQVARSYANGIETLAAVLHELVLKGGHQQEVIKLRGQWVQIDPSTWRKRYDFRISVGYASGNKDAMVSRLMLIAQLQEKAAAGGLPIVQPANIYETAIELTKASDFAAPERFWTDPATAKPPGPPQPDPTVIAAEQIKSQTTKEVTNVNATVDKYKADLDSQTKLAIEQMKSENQRQLEQFRAEHSVGMEEFKGRKALELEHGKSRMKDAPALEVADKVEQMAATLEETVRSLQNVIATVLTAKKQIRRGKDGRAEGVDVIGPDGSVLTSQSVVRGPDGKAIGTA
jgi:hypothetical protein